ncbi:MAG TPA: branched-chain amino acid ABC transporter substrate-binding protein [Solirubrobacterales bacterium]|jgi:branched-chain amino acid transport system substrate-binding protein|nr:branched-chain amino acid ABC transporter substrate-binding protein [Solirubrobacterales bacterium]
MPFPRLVTAVALATLVMLAAGCGNSGSDDSSSGSPDSASGKFRVGLEAPLSGELSVLGEGMLDGAQLAAAQLNEGDGILGKQVEVVPIDDAGDPATGVKAAKAAIADGLDGVVGPYNSGVGIETLPLYIDAGLTPIRLTSDNSTNGLGFTLQPMTYQIAPVASQAVTEWQGAKNVAIAYDPTQNYTASVSKALKSSLEKAGVTVTAYEKVQPGKKSYTGVIGKLTTGNPDVIYAAVYFPEGGLIAKEMDEGNVESQCIADYGSYDTGFVEVAGIAAAKGCPLVGVPAPEDFAGAGELVAQYRDKFGQAPGTWSPYTYDSLNFLAAGVEEAGGTDPDALTEALDEVSDWQGWTGSVTIDPTNGNRRPATVVVVDTDAKGQLHVDKSWAKAVGAPYDK